jgi:hypothetical protein
MQVTHGFGQRRQGCGPVEVNGECVDVQGGLVQPSVGEKGVVTAVGIDRGRRRGGDEAEVRVVGEGDVGVEVVAPEGAFTG